jgi:hypothetical protein
MYNDLPIFCDNCSALALAELDAAPLCERCLVKAVDRAKSVHIISQIEPLKFNQPKFITKSFSMPKDAVF